MKRIIIAALTIFTIEASQAEYTIKQPLEQSLGGSLPSGSIQFATSNTTPSQDPTAEIECNVLDAYPGYFWSIISSNTGFYSEAVRWDAANYSINHNVENPLNPASYTRDGYIYTKGELHHTNDLGSGNLAYVYEVCRQPL